MSSSIAVDRLKAQFTPIHQIPKIHEELRNNFSNGITKTLEWRMHQLKQLGYLLQENEALFEEALSIDLGRPKTESQVGELIGVRHEILNVMKNLKSWVKPQSVKTDLTWMIARPKIYHEAKGLVVIFGAWNYPVALSIIPLIGAIAGGNAVILKPSELSPATANLITELVPKYMDPDHIRIINGAVDECNALLDLHSDHIFFTGSTKVGRIVAKRAAETLTPVTLELGGKSPVIVFDDADFAVTGRRLVWGKAMNAGQTCVAPDFIMVSKKSETKLIESIKQAVKEFYPQPSLKAEAGHQDGVKEPQYSQIVNSNSFDRLNACLQQTKGEIIRPEGSFQSKDEKLRFPLALVQNVTSDDPVMQDEIFGPILPILTFDPEKETIAEILRPINESEPLALYVFTQSPKNFELVRQHSKSGQLVCNDLLIQFSIPGLPFGGIGKSGSGNYHGHHSFLTFTYERATANLAPWADFLFNMRYPPYTASKLKLFSTVSGPSPIKGRSNPGSVPRTNRPTPPGWFSNLSTLKITALSLIVASYCVFSRTYGPGQFGGMVGRLLGSVKKSIN